MDVSFPNKSLPLPSGSTSSPTPKTALPQTSDTPDNTFRKPADGFTPTTRFPNARLRSPWVRTPMATAVQFTPTSPLLQKTPVSTALLATSKGSTPLQTAFSTPSDLDSTQMGPSSESSFLQTAVYTPSSFRTSTRFHRYTQKSCVTAIDLDSSDDWGLLDSRPSTKSRFTPYKKSVSCSDLKTAASIESTRTALPIMPDVSRLSTDDSLNWSSKSFDTLKTCWIESSTQTAFSPKMDSETAAPIPLDEAIPLEMVKKMQMLEKISTLHGRQLDKTRDRLDILVDSLLRTIGMLNSAILKAQAQEEKIKALEETIRHNNS